MIKRYRIANCPEIVEVISVDDLKDLVQDGFLILQVSTLNPEAVNDMVESLGLGNFPFPVVVTDMQTSVHEILEEKERTDAGK